MMNNERSEAVSGLRDLFAEIDAINPGGSKLVQEGISYLQSKDFNSERGALTDVVAPDGATTEARRKAQVLASTIPDSGQITSSRRDVLRQILKGGQAITLGASGGFLGDRVSKWVDESDALDEAFVRQILRLHSDRPALKELAKTYINNGKWKEAEIIQLLTVSGEGFANVFDSINRLGNIISGSQLSKFSRVYLELGFCTQHRYLGLWHQAAYLFKQIDSSDCGNRNLNVLLLNHMYSFHNRVGDTTTVAASAFSAENVRFQDSVFDRLQIDLASLSQGAFQEAQQVSVECVSLKGIFCANQFMAARDEKEALEALGLIDQFRRCALASIIKDASDAGHDWLAVRLYGEVIWNYSRIAPFAFGRGWTNALERCLNSFYNVEACFSITERRIQVMFHNVEKNQLRSPLWIQMALICAMYEHTISRSGQHALNSLLPIAQRHKIRRHVSLQRVLDALSVALGRDPRNINRMNTLYACENKVLLNCVDIMKSRCT